MALDLRCTWRVRRATAIRPTNCQAITQNGRAAGVPLRPAKFDALTERIRFVNAVATGLEDARSGRVVTHESMVAEVQTRYGDPE